MPAKPAQPHGITAPERGQEQVDRLGRRHGRLRVDRQAKTQVQQGQQRPHRDLVADRQVARERRHRDTRCCEDPPHRGSPSLAAHDDRHVGPRHTVHEVGPPQHRRDVRAFLGHGTQQGHLDLPAVAGRHAPPLGAPTERTDTRDDPAARLAELARLPVCRAQDDRVQVAEGRPVAEEQTRVGPSEGLHGAVRVAEEDDLHRGCGHGGQQSSGGGRELLGVIDDHETKVRAEPFEGTGVVVEPLGSGRQDPRRVVGAGPRERGDLVVLRENGGRGDPFRSPVAIPQAGQCRRVQAVLDGSHEQVTQLRPKPAGGQGRSQRLRPRRPTAQLGVPGEQLTQDDVLLRAAEQPRGGLAGEGRLAAQDAEPERLVGAGQRLGGRGAEPGGHSLAQARRRQPGRREQQALVRRQSAPVHPLDEQLDRGQRLAGAWATENPQCRTGIPQHRGLLAVEGRDLGSDRLGPAKRQHGPISPRGTDSHLPGPRGTAAGLPRLIGIPPGPLEVDAIVVEAGPHEGRALSQVALAGRALQPGWRVAASPHDAPPGHVRSVAAQHGADRAGPARAHHPRELAVGDHPAGRDLLDELEDPFDERGQAVHQPGPPDGRTRGATRRPAPWRSTGMQTTGA